MTYSPPSIGPAGLSLPMFSDILEYYITGMQNIYGQSVYLGNDTTDYQFLSLFALAANDCMSCCQIAYNSFGALTTTGAAQDQLYKINGISRKVPTYSTCILYLTGTAGYTVTNGKAIDINNYIWDLPTTVVFNSSGNATVTATCETIGEISALPGNINTIYTPTYGWISVTNNYLAVTGQPVESDSQFRVRQTNSTSIASTSPLDSVIAAIAALPGVTRYAVFENPTGSSLTDPNGLGLPAHSITVVVEGGISTAIANAIWIKKTIGTQTNGNTTIPITDQYNNITPINYYILQYDEIYVTINLHALNSNYTAAVGTAIIAAVTSYLNSLSIGEPVLISALQSVAQSANPDIYHPVCAIRSVIAGTSLGGQSSSDIAIAFNYAAQGVSSNIYINPVA